jgi:hypothetical protein
MLLEKHTEDLVYMPQPEVEIVMDAAAEAWAKIGPRKRVTYCHALGSRWKVTSSFCRLMAVDTKNGGRRCCRWY